MSSCEEIKSIYSSYNNKFKSLVQDLEDVEGKGADPYYFLLSLYQSRDVFPDISKNHKDIGITLANVRSLCRLLGYDQSFAVLENRGSLMKNIYEDNRYESIHLRRIRKKLKKLNCSQPDEIDEIPQSMQSTKVWYPNTSQYF
ncbi:MAG: hypothetical protein Sylvanvirus29_4 [Sylvanvirus sp.]|uniref:Uncharacterized protein n=1 Tax=Sylvanvirus sp. TaxID=2487774 RepID=A0A3G5AIV6_9VIRU|nr:MAG: hypothetical protein Sylvanvirus29_4 [Sylvanvirus sp.]